ncbi:tripartite motif-containing protein 16-like protein [Polypterus senegalus]|nr:tripartite motif-containing protein 16-like protein [Polypterus senegalus]
MAANVQPEKLFKCSICLETSDSLMSIPCGHRYCVNCVKNCWDQKGLMGDCSCAQCCEAFSQKPAPQKKPILAGIMVRRLQEVSREVHTRRIFKNEVQIQPHCVNGTEKPQSTAPQVCPQHNMDVEYFCVVDNCCVCSLCILEEHKNHEMVPIEKDRAKQERQLEVKQIEIQHKIRKKQQKLEDMKWTVKFVKNSARREAGKCDRIFADLIHSIEKSRHELNEMIRAQEDAIVKKADDVMGQLEGEIEDLKKINLRLRQLSKTDQCHFFQNFKTLCIPSKGRDLPKLPRSVDGSFENFSRELFSLKQQVDKLLRRALMKVTQNAGKAQIYSVTCPERIRRETFTPYTFQPTLDRNTLQRKLWLSEDQRMVTLGRESWPYPSHPERFDQLHQVLCIESLSGARSYWEVQWSGRGAMIGVTYKSIGRKGAGNDCSLGRNNKSWGLWCSGSMYAAWHDNQETKIAAARCHRIGVYLDYPAGTLAFYGLSETAMILLHKFETTFIKPLHPAFCFFYHYPGFYVNFDSSITICQLSQSAQP